MGHPLRVVASAMCDPTPAVTDGHPGLARTAGGFVGLDGLEVGFAGVVGLEASEDNGTDLQRCDSDCGLWWSI